jgi:DNA-binding HxlR family transcriptional regulator
MTDEENEKIVRRSPVPKEACTLARSFELIGDRWSLLILRSALYGVRRFDDFHADLDIPRSVLSSRLSLLVENGLLERRAYREEGRRTRVEYPLAEKGRALAIPFLAFAAWGARWLDAEPNGLQFFNRRSGEALDVALIDKSGERVPLRDVEIRVARKGDEADGA